MKYVDINFNKNLLIHSPSEEKACSILFVFNAEVSI